VVHGHSSVDKCVRQARLELCTAAVYQLLHACCGPCVDDGIHILGNKR
jgi:hypothetical protein